ITLRDRDLLKQIGDVGALVELQTFVAAAENFQYYLDIVRDKYLLRQTLRAAELIKKDVQSPEVEPLQLLDVIESRIASIRSLDRDGANTFEDAATEIAKPIVELPDVIEGILHQGDKASFGGATKARKTWLLLDIAVSVASGAPWFAGFGTCKGKVLYVNFE